MPTAAPSLAKLYDFESQLEQAAQKLLSDAGFNVISAVIPVDPATGQPQKIDDDSTVVSAEVGGATGARGFKPGTDGEEEYYIYDFTLKITHSVSFSAPSTEGGLPQFVKTLREERAEIRVLFLESQDLLASLLDWLDILTLIPAPVQARPDTARGVNLAEIPYRGQFAIKPTAWPAGA